jgi:HlyD family secretion protein
MASLQLKKEKLEPELRGRLMLATALVGILTVGLGTWAATAKLAGAVIAPGMIVVDNSIKKVQHPAGGVVGHIGVRNGDLVAAGDLVVRLDETQARSSLGVIVKQMLQLEARRARLAAERDGLDKVTFAPGFTSQSEEAAEIATSEARLFDQRVSGLQGQKAQLQERIGQLQQESMGLQSQHRAKLREVELMREELARVQDMRRRNLVPQPRELSAERDLTRLEGEEGQLLAQIARTRGQVSETELQIISADRNFQTEAGRELREVEGRLAELSERRIAAEDLLKRIDIRAPQAGIVHELAVHTVGGVIGPGETIMSIVPVEDQLSIEVRVPPNDIDQVSVGRAVELRFPALNQRTTPELKGHVSRVAADVSRDTQNGAYFYTARIHVDASEIEKLKAQKLLPGMPVEGYISTGERTALSFFVKPLTDQLSRVFREE